ncbi:MAG TPA: TIGR03435 family protein [Bryobacteraceae bacterium]|nr:TIGR03435 family protein [Bryobacteraceae bacterium]
MVKIARFLALALLSGAPALAQQATFEAASVHPSDPRSAPVNRSANAQATLRGGPGTADPGRISYANITLQSLLIVAYGADCKIQDDCDQVIGPAWLRSNRYDMEAKLPGDTTAEQFRAMLQNLLAERFRMALHRETRDFPGYDLTLAKRGSKLIPSPASELGTGDPAGPLVKFGAPGQYGELLRPGFLIFPYKGTRSTANHAVGREQSLAEITRLLGNLMNARIVDKTGMSGKYDFTIDWVPDGVTMIQEADGPEIAPPHGLPTAIEDQLGLKLVRTKITLDAIVVDNADKIPAAN